MKATPKIALKTLAAGIAAGLVLGLLGSTIHGFIDPNFTPNDLAQQSETILVITLKAAKGNELEAEKIEVLKPKVPDKIVVNLASAKADQQEDLKKIFERNEKQPIILFIGTFNHEKKAFMHVDGAWLSVKSADGQKWDIEEFNSKLGGTYAGGTDMLIRMEKYLLNDPNGNVPVTVGTKWMDNKKLGMIPGKVCGLAAVDLKNDKTIHAFVGSADGDKLYRPKKTAKGFEEEFEDVTAASKLDSKSRQFAWVDMDRDGIADLVSWDGTGISVRLVGADGVFKPAEAGKAFQTEGECAGLAPVSVSPDGAPALIVSSGHLPILLEWNGQWKKTELPTGKAAQDAAGESSPCVVADLDNDGFPDILQPRDAAGVFWKGKAGGFSEPVLSAATGGGGVSAFTLGDFDADGAIDIFISGQQKNELWENNGKAAFKGVIGHAGSLSYKTPPGASECRVTDLNHDGRPDLCMLYHDKDFTYHFCRGYRCMGEEGELKLPGLQEAGGGQQGCVTADFNGDGSQDLVVVSNNGSVICYYNDAFDLPGLRVRLKKGMSGAVAVSLWQGEKDLICVGTYNVTGFAGTHFSVRYPGDVVVKYGLPGKPNQTKKVVIEKGTSELIIGE